MKKKTLLFLLPLFFFPIVAKAECTVDPRFIVVEPIYDPVTGQAESPRTEPGEKGKEMAPGWYYYTPIIKYHYEVSVSCLGSCANGGTCPDTTTAVWLETNDFAAVDGKGGDAEDAVRAEIQKAGRDWAAANPTAACPCSPPCKTSSTPTTPPSTPAGNSNKPKNNKTTAAVITPKSGHK